MCHMHTTPMSSFLIDTFAQFDEGMMAEHVSRSAWLWSTSSGLVPRVMIDLFLGATVAFILDHVSLLMWKPIFHDAPSLVRSDAVAYKATPFYGRHIFFQDH